MRKNLFMVALIVAVGLFLAFTVRLKENKTDEKLQGCVPPCPMVMVNNTIDFSKCCNPPAGVPIVYTHPKIQVYGCPGTLHDWIDLCDFAGGLVQLPCLNDDCGTGCATGLYMFGYDMPFPASGGVATYTAPGTDCWCTGQTLRVTINCSGPNCSITLDCI